MTQRHLILLVRSAESQRSRRAKKGKYTVLLCVSKHNKSAAGLKGRMTRRFFFHFSLFALLTAYFIVYLLSLLSYPASANPPPLRIHKASSYLFTRFLAAFLLLFSPLALPAAAADLRVGKLCWDSSEFHLSGGKHMEAPPPFRRNWFVLLCLPSLLLPPLSSSRPPPLLLSLPSLLGGVWPTGTSMYKHTRLRTKK